MNQSWKKVFSSAIVALEATLAPHPAYQYPPRSRRALRPFLPYCLHEAGEVREDAFIWLNRDYKPLGIATNERVDYGKYPWLHVSKDESVAIRGRFWLFGDLNPPWDSKKDAERLLSLMRLLVKPGLSLMDTDDRAFAVLAKDRSNQKFWGLE
jgi:hypothetical protein